MSPLRIRVVGNPVSVNAMYKRRMSGQVYVVPEAFTWKQAVWATVLQHSPQPCVCHALIPPLRVDVTFYGVRGDADNYLKATLDGLKLALRIDDKHFTTVTAHVVRATKEPRGCLIEVTSAAQETQA